jgi:phospho-N-acetylmuramoyl-pentapeptide-transferase
MIAVVGLFTVCLLMTLLLGNPLIRALRALSYQQHAYEDAPKSHAKKTGTPTMGGICFVFALLAVVIWHPQTWPLVLLGLLCAAVGVLDDAAKIRGARNRGVSARVKFALTLAVGLVFFVSVARSGYAYDTAGVITPLWYLLGLLVILATTNAVNLTDGLDGLAAGTVMPPLAVFAWIAWRVGETGVMEVDVATLGAVLGFWVYNRYPAKMFMGDTGALLLGGILGGSAILTGTIFLLPLIGGVFVAETLSVILQVTYFKRTGKRIFRMSPLHHHFELAGWSETTVTRRFAFASVVLSIIGAVLVR